MRTGFISNQKRIDPTIGRSIFKTNDLVVLHHFSSHSFTYFFFCKKTALQHTTKIQKLLSNSTTASTTLSVTVVPANRTSFHKQSASSFRGLRPLFSAAASWQNTENHHRRITDQRRRGQSVQLTCQPTSFFFLQSDRTNTV